jgi:SAM-dependent methyltransferase
MNDHSLREVALAGPEHLDPGYVAGYDRKAGFDPTDDLEGLRARGLGATSILVDLGAGTGTLAVAAAAVCKRVVAVDVSPAMVDAIRSKAAAAGAANVECVQAGFVSYEHEGDAPDFIYTRHALHHLPDFWKGIALGRMAGWLAPGGILQLRDLVFSFDLPEAATALASWIRTAAADRAEDGWTREELETHLRDEYSTFTWLLEPLLTRAGFEIVAADHGTAGVYANYICRLAKPNKIRTGSGSAR